MYGRSAADALSVGQAYDDSADSIVGEWEGRGASWSYC